METSILGHDSEDCGVEVFDQRGNRHALTIAWDGTVREHSTQDYPLKVEDRTDEEQRIMTQVEHRARYAAQLEFPDEEELFGVPQMPGVLSTGIEAVQGMGMDRFADEFREYYEATKDPSPYLPSGVPAEDTVAISLALALDEDEMEVTKTGAVQLLYLGEEGPNFAGEGQDFEGVEEWVVLYLPPLEYPSDFTYPEEFKTEVIANLTLQMRDICQIIGEEPPEYARTEDGYRVYPVPVDDEEPLIHW